MSQNPYRSLAAKAFWRSAITDQSLLEIDGLWSPKFRISKSDPVSTAGSCFAQHIGRALKAGGYHWFDAEPPPSIARTDLGKAYNYGVFSFRTGNIYTAASLRQWLSWSLGATQPPDEVWEENGRYFDPFRPVIEPDGFGSIDELLASRRTVLAAVRRAVERSSVLVFTLGLTESWEDRSGWVYPICPGTSAGQFDPDRHLFLNYSYARVQADMLAAIELMRSVNPCLRILLTVSPVPLAATASGNHVLTASTYSKSTLRAVAGDLAAADEAVDYFPSYEIITGFPFRGRFFEPDLRNVTPEGVAFVMRSFFGALGEPQTPPPASRTKAPITQTGDSTDDLACEEAILESFR